MQKSNRECPLKRQRKTLQGRNVTVTQKRAEEFPLRVHLYTKNGKQKKTVKFDYQYNYEPSQHVT